LLDKFLKTRAAVKRTMKSEKDPFRHSVLDGRQLAIKLCANSVYGYTKGHICRDNDIMSAVTACGRNMLKISKETVLADGVLGDDGIWRGGFKGRPVVDVEACRRMGIDPETIGEADCRPRMPCQPTVIYGDTDSVMISFGNTTLAEVMRFGQEAAKACTAKFEAPCALLFEAVKLRALYLNRKRYAALQIENLIPGERIADAIARAIKGGDRCTVFKGLESKRRDNAPIGGGTQAKVLTILMHEANVEKAEQVVKDVVADLLMGRVDMSELVISKGLTKTEEQYARGGTKQQHVELRKRIKARALATGETVPETGDRVPFVMLAGTAKKSGKGHSKASELSEDPLHAMRTGAPIDIEYYIKKQILPAVMRVFVGVHEPEKCYKFKSGLSDKDLQDFKSYHRLFAPHLPHMKSKVVPRARNFGIAAWARSIPSCLGCGASMTYKSGTDSGPVCRNCDRDTIHFKKAQEHGRRQEAHDKAWDTCRTCQGGSFGKVTCSNMSCDNFFHREKVIIDLEDIAKEMKRFL
jgi:DNA polymerase delta subunit 1